MQPAISRRGFLAGGAATLSAQASSPPDAAAAISHSQEIRSRYVSLRGALPVPSVAIALIDDKSINLAALRGKIVVVNFWATWCPGCRQELPLLQNLTNRRIPDLQVLAVAADREPRKAIAEFVKALGLSKLAIGLAPEPLIDRKDSEQRSPFVLYAVPITYLIGKSGIVEGYFLGQVDWSRDDALALLDTFR
jgi:thiol-disulfide isomerase/thioredoxin